MGGAATQQVAPLIGQTVQTDGSQQSFPVGSGQRHDTVHPQEIRSGQVEDMEGVTLHRLGVQDQLPQENRLLRWLDTQRGLDPL